MDTGTSEAAAEAGTLTAAPAFDPHAASTPSEAAPSLLVRLTSVVDRLDFHRLFPCPQPIEIELGCGDASFLLNYARRHAERNFLGIERLLGRIRKLDRKGRRAGLTNLRGLRVESVYFLRCLAPPGSVAALHIYFPDPWPKRRHWKNRLVNAAFPDLAQQVLAPGGSVFLRTDHAGYFEQMKEVFAGRGDFVLIETPAELAAVRTDFEEDFAARGVATLRLAFKRV